MLKHALTLAVLALSSAAAGQTVRGTDVTVTSGGKAYKSYLAAPASAAPKPAVILLHSFRGLEPGYRDLVNELAAAGFVTLALGWQTFEREPSDAAVKALVEDGLKFLGARRDVNMNAVGLTGFCAGGRYTMLLLPQIKQFKAGVAWYGFPDQGGTAAKPQPPSAFIGQLTAPLLIIHGTRDQASPIASIYAYAQKLDAANKTFKLSVYQGEPHGFLLTEGQIADTFASRDAQQDMLNYFRAYLR
ncbi:dienelactone hydrolase family protein [Deinococcus metallilatus]|uniref:Carboxymethylenebutenolidase n=1 Tax=Deinococcus metallilatus TaxID=1211322 RepID=A0AAJ5F1G4_9DEIO|nr:dienelactone hydrolase family protein [Deinococcus metallilatus]MBB5297169.1 carboxymethylenebutenolidase [Deinococcus metallilatus]QBY10047.1 dienelactone hydrolase family protein [Deinococcus metallilatus]RXJ08302.1 dienelactone hydrolase family protein [Deinococcus metallilatus]TLK21988.1 dienelactone hydrolase family protein [Deinococcus metallilatus]GMA17266.1 dienelactone hydrolase family protein [Deinococcus metallilatus]